MSAFVCGGLTLMTAYDVRSAAVAVLLRQLAATASPSPIMTPLLYEANVPERAGLAASLFRFSLYFSVATLGNAAGLLLGCFEPQPSGSHLIYGREAWTKVSTGLFLCALLMLRLALCVSGNGRPMEKRTSA